MRLLLLADTHVPKRARALPDVVWDAVAEADLVIHAGDWVDVALLDELQNRAAAVLACWGTTTGRSCERGCPRWVARTSRAFGWR